LACPAWAGEAAALVSTVASAVPVVVTAPVVVAVALARRRAVLAVPGRRVL
jgi:hypothetical protein